MHIDYLIEKFKYQIEGGCSFAWDCFPKGTRLMDFNNVSVIFNERSKCVFGLLITPVNAPGEQYVWVIEAKEVDFYREVTTRGARFNRLDSYSVAILWAEESFKNHEVDLTQDEYIELNLSDEALDKLNALLAAGISFDKLLEDALNKASSNDISADSQTSSNTP
jgi:hypothetical protein